MKSPITPNMAAFLLGLLLAIGAGAALADEPQRGPTVKELRELLDDETYAAHAASYMRGLLRGAHYSYSYSLFQGGLKAELARKLAAGHCIAQEEFWIEVMDGQIEKGNGDLPADIFLPGSYVSVCSNGSNQS